jgi:hypothetical protein
MVREALLSLAPVPAVTIHPIPTEARSMTLKNMLGHFKANSRDKREIRDRLSNGRGSFRGCSTTSVLTQLFIERDAGAGAVHPITLLKIGCGFVGIRSYNHAAATNSRRVSAHSVVDLATGDVLKAASWTASAKGARQHI